VTNKAINPKLENVTNKSIFSIFGRSLSLTCILKPKSF